jgi:hypothetical protein
LRSGEKVDGCCGKVVGLIMEVESELCDEVLNPNGGGGGECAAQGADSAGLSSALQAEEQSRRVVKFVDEIASPRADHALDNRPDSAFSRLLMLQCSHMVQAGDVADRRSRFIHPRWKQHPPGHCRRSNFLSSLQTRNPQLALLVFVLLSVDVK